MHIANNNLASPLLKDTFTILGSSKYEVLSVLDLKDAFHLLYRLTIPKSNAEFSHILEAHHIYTREYLWDSLIPLQSGNPT